MRFREIFFKSPGATFSNGSLEQPIVEVEKLTGEEINKKYNQQGPEIPEDLIGDPMVFALELLKGELIIDGSHNKIPKDLYEQITSKPLINLLSGKTKKQDIVYALGDLLGKPGLELKKYISADKRFDSVDDENTNTKHMQVDPIDCLKSMGNSYGNIMIGELDTIPKDKNNDVYRYELLKEINRVTSLGGYFLESDSFSEFFIRMPDGKLKKLNVSDFGFEKINTQILIDSHLLVGNSTPKDNLTEDSTTGFYRKVKNIEDLEIFKNIK